MDDFDDDDFDDEPVEAKINLDDILGKQNIVDLLDKDLLKKIAKKVLEDYDIDFAFFSAGRKNEVDQYIADCKMSCTPKTYPFVGASNIKYPMLLSAMINYVSIALPAIYADGQVAKFEIVGKDMPMPVQNPEEQQGITGYKEQKARRVSEMMNLQFKKQSFFDILDRALQVQSITGFATIKVFWDSIKNMPDFKVLMPQEVIVDANASDYSKCSRITEEIKYYPHEIEELIRLGIFTKFNYKTSGTGLDEEELNADVDLETTDDDDDAPHLFLQQYRTIDLDGDGYPEPYCVTIHKSSERVVRIYPQFDDEDIKINDKGDIAYINPCIEYIKIPMMPDFEGSFYDIGLGDMLSMIQKGISTSANMSIDAMHQNIAGGGMMLKSLKVLGGQVRMQPRQWLKVDASPEELQNGFREFPRSEPSPVMLAFIEMLIKSGDDLSVFKKLDVTTMPANMPATTALAVADQGMQVFKSVFKRVHHAIDKLLTLLLRINKKYLDVDVYVQETGLELYEEDLSGNDYDIIPSADPDVINSTQKYMQAQLLTTLLTDPYINAVNARKKILQTANLDADEFITIPQPPQPDPLSMAQAGLLQAQSQLTMAQAQSVGVDTQLKPQKEMTDNMVKQIDSKVKEATIIEKIANATQKVADAEAKEEGTQLQTYQTYIDASQRMVGNDT